MEAIKDLAEHPEKFKDLEIEDQLQIVADIILYWANKESDAMAEYGKSSIEAKRMHDTMKYWDNLQMNIKKLAELESTRLRRGI